MYHYLQTIVEKIHDHLILCVGTNDATDFHQQIVNNLLALKHFKTKKKSKTKM